MLVFLPYYRTRAITGKVGDSAPRVTISKVAVASFQPGEAPAFTDSKGGAFPCAHGSSSLTSPGKLAVLKAQTLVLPTLAGTLPAGAELPTHSVRPASAPWPQGPLTALPNTAAWSPIFESMSLSLPSMLHAKFLDMPLLSLRVLATLPTCFCACVALL